MSDQRESFRFLEELMDEVLAYAGRELDEGRWTDGDVGYVAEWMRCAWVDARLEMGSSLGRFVRRELGSPSPTPST